MDDLDEMIHGEISDYADGPSPPSPDQLDGRSNASEVRSQARHARPPSLPMSRKDRSVAERAECPVTGSDLKPLALCPPPPPPSPASPRHPLFLIQGRDDSRSGSLLASRSRGRKAPPQRKSSLNLSHARIARATMPHIRIGSSI